MKRKLLSLLLAAAFALSAFAALPGAAWGAAEAGETEPEAPEFYTDVSETIWYYPYVRALYDMDVLPQTETFGPKVNSTRVEFVQWLYGLHLALGGGANTREEAVFQDVPVDSEGFDAVMWAYDSGVVTGRSKTTFDPDSLISREQCCAILMRFANVTGVPLVKAKDAQAFQDSTKVSKYARSYVVASQMAGMINGKGGGLFVPQDNATRSEVAAMLYRLWQAAERAEEPDPEMEYVDTAPDAYLSFYESVYNFAAPIPESEAVSPDWLDNAVFIGDSVSVRLQMYCESTQALGGATFLCTTSFSAPNALAPVTNRSLHPKYQGVKMKVEDAVAACGAKNVYIMLGINNMYSALSNSTSSLVRLIQSIQKTCPDVNIIVQSVTPLAATSNILSDTMNNGKVDQYNAMMQEYCAQYGWYFLDVASRLKDAQGNLAAEYCGDSRSMGIHLTNAAAKVWVDYLLTHVPEGLK